MDDDEVKEIQDWLQTKRETTFRWGTRMLRGGQRYYSPCALDRTGWENFCMSLPYDYDIRNDKVFNASSAIPRSSAWETWDSSGQSPQFATCKALRTGACGPEDDMVDQVTEGKCSLYLSWNMIEDFVGVAGRFMQKI